MDRPEPVECTSHIKFCPELKTFSLTAGNTLYSFCIGPELTLEHLYWGVHIDGDYDFRYLSQSLRHAHFSTVESAPLKFGGKIFSEAETLEEVQKTWKDNNSMGRRVPGGATRDMAAIQRRRLENYSWRILSKATQEGQGKTPPPGRALSTPRWKDRAPSLRSRASTDIAASMDLS